MSLPRKQSNGSVTIFKSDDYNYIFNMKTGRFDRWGTTLDDDPKWSKYGPEILDIEISSGSCLGKCKFCYKCNGSGESKHMDLYTYIDIIEKMKGNLTQVALGLTDVKANPHLSQILNYTRSIGIVPNYTTHGLDLGNGEIFDAVSMCGAVAVSIVDHRSFHAIRNLIKAGMKYVNIHFMLSEQTLAKAFDVIETIKNDDVLKKITAIVFLQFKPKGFGVDEFSPVRDLAWYPKLLSACKEAGIGCGFDSCSAPMFLKTCDERLHRFVEPCESGLFSSYVNVDGDFFPCSFMENVGDWKTGISVLDCNDFLSDIWLGGRLERWRNNLINSSKHCNCKFKNSCRSCPTYGISVCK